MRIWNDNLKIFADDNLQSYLSKELKIFSGRINWKDFVICKLDDVEIEFWHEQIGEEVPKKWNKRKDRINYDKLILVIVGDLPEGATTDFYKVIVDIGYDTVTLYKKGKKKTINFGNRKTVEGIYPIDEEWLYWTPIFRDDLKYKIALWWFIKYY